MKGSTRIARAPWTTKPRPRTVRSDVDPALRRLIHARAGGNCELCGEGLPPVAWQAHHRLLKGQGGLDAANNLLALHVLCHRRAHTHVHWALDQGFLVSAHADPGLCPVAQFLTRWVLLTPAGGVVDTDPPDTSEEST